MEQIKVLMIDDNVNLIEMVKEYFSTKEGIKITTWAYDGEEGIKLLEAEKDNIDLIVLDLIMPKKDGLYVLEEMNLTLPDCSFIYTLKDCCVELFVDGCYFDCVTKAGDIPKSHVTQNPLVDTYFKERFARAINLERIDMAVDLIKNNADIFLLN